MTLRSSGMVTATPAGATFITSAITVIGNRVRPTSQVTATLTASTVVRARRGVDFTPGLEWPALEASEDLEAAASTEAAGFHGRWGWRRLSRRWGRRRRPRRPLTPNGLRLVGLRQPVKKNRLDYRAHPRSRSAGELVALLVSSQQRPSALSEQRQPSYGRPVTSFFLCGRACGDGFDRLSR